MKFVTSDILAKKAKEKGYAVPALNTNGATYDITRAIIEKASELNSPLIIQCYEPNLDYRGYSYFVSLVKELSENSEIPIAIQLDHGKSEKGILKALKAGFTSVMIDYAHLPLEQNIEGTKRVKSMAHALSASVEGEIGHILISSDKGTERTTVVDYNMAVEYAKKASPDLLAAALGTTHGIFEIQETIDFELLAKLSSNIEIPLVLHGTCGVPLQLIEKCAKSGISKINFGENLRMGYINHMREVLENYPHDFHAWKAMEQTKDRLKLDIEKLIVACGSCNRAKDF